MIHFQQKLLNNSIFYTLLAEYSIKLSNFVPIIWKRKRIRMANNNLNAAKAAKKDEFYTQLEDINNELRHYREQFRGKTVLCNCDDPRVSNFFTYFAYNFEFLGLKRLITTCYKNQDADLFSQHQSEKAVYLIYEGDKNGNNIPDPEEIGIHPLKGDGDFRSRECVELLKEADIVVTNPPFSLFREYVAQLIEYDKKFLIIGHQRALQYKEIVPYIMDNKIWLGYGFKGGAAHFISAYDDVATAGDHREGMIRVSGVVWFTNLETKKRQEKLILYKKYTPNDYQTYDNYNAINVDKTDEIPFDYDGVMGVPITFMDKYNPEQFEILGVSGKYGFGLESTRLYDDFREIRQDGTETGSSGKKTNGNPMLKGRPDKGNYYRKGNEEVYSLYTRLFIRHKKQ